MSESLHARCQDSLRDNTAKLIALAPFPCKPKGHAFMNHGTATIYVIDDDPSFLAAVVRLIGTGGYTVEGMNTLAEFRARLPLREPCCILADVMLSGESGLEVVSILEARGDPTPIVFMSATDNREQIDAASVAGVVPCLPKPVEAEDLFAALQTALDASPQAIEGHLSKEREIR